MIGEQLSAYMTDEELSEFLAGCASGLYEAWMPHPCWPYLVSSFGRIWSPHRNRVFTPYRPWSVAQLSKKR